MDLVGKILFCGLLKCTKTVEVLSLTSQFSFNITESYLLSATLNILRSHGIE